MGLRNSKQGVTNRELQEMEIEEGEGGEKEMANGEFAFVSGKRTRKEFDGLYEGSEIKDLEESSLVSFLTEKAKRVYFKVFCFDFKAVIELKLTNQLDQAKKKELLEKWKESFLNLEHFVGFAELVKSKFDAGKFGNMTHAREMIAKSGSMTLVALEMYKGNMDDAFRLFKECVAVIKNAGAEPMIMDLLEGEIGADFEKLANDTNMSYQLFVAPSLRQGKFDKD